jgi:hypothetical protein
MLEEWRLEFSETMERIHVFGRPESQSQIYFAIDVESWIGADHPWAQRVTSVWEKGSELRGEGRQAARGVRSDGKLDIGGQRFSQCRVIPAWRRENLHWAWIAEARVEFAVARPGERDNGLQRDRECRVCRVTRVIIGSGRVLALQRGRECRVCRVATCSGPGFAHWKA